MHTDVDDGGEFESDAIDADVAGPTLVLLVKCEKPVGKAAEDEVEEYEIDVGREFETIRSDAYVADSISVLVVKIEERGEMAAEVRVEEYETNDRLIALVGYVVSGVAVELEPWVRLPETLTHEES